MKQWKVEFVRYDLSARWEKCTANTCAFLHVKRVKHVIILRFEHGMDIVNCKSKFAGQAGFPRKYIKIMPANLADSMAQKYKNAKVHIGGEKKK